MPDFCLVAGEIDGQGIWKLDGNIGCESATTRSIAYRLKIGKNVRVSGLTSCPPDDYYVLPAASAQLATDGRQIDLTFASHSTILRVTAKTELNQLSYSIEFKCTIDVPDGGCQRPTIISTRSSGQCRQEQEDSDLTDPRKTSEYVLTYLHPAKSKNTDATKNSPDFSFDSSVQTVWIDATGKGSVSATVKLGGGT